jgi:hypothetical protein
VESLQEYLQTVEKVESVESAAKLAENPLTSAIELALAKCGLYDRSLFEPPILLDCGAAPLFKGLYYSWGAFPYPKEHAIFVLQLEAMEQRELAAQMASFQQVYLDDNGEWIPSLFSQEGIRGFGEGTALMRQLLSLFSCEPLPKFYVNEELSLARLSWEGGCALFTGAGCMSGQGAFLVGSQGCINFGPQRSSLGDCSQFGIVGQGKQFQCDEQTVEVISSLGELIPRKYALAHLQDATIEKQWLKMSVQFGQNALHICGEQKALHRPVTLFYSFFLKGEACFVSKLHKLNPKSLDRYLGPPGTIEVLGQQGNVRIEWGKGIKRLEVIPLAGDESYWGADFLAFVHVEPTFNFSFFTS